MQFGETYPDLPSWPLFSPLTIAVVGTVTVLHLLRVAYQSDRAERWWLAIAVPALVTLPLVPLWIGAHAGCGEDGANVRLGDRWLVSLLLLAPLLGGLHGLYRLAGAEGARAWVAPVLVTVVGPVVFVAEAILSYVGLFTLCDRRSWTVPIVHGALGVTVVLAGAVAARVQHGHWA